ncbi:hypothetical protein [Candidatus Nitrospira bockiana]
MPYELVTAKVLDERRILSRWTAYRMARLKLIPCYYVGPKRKGIRFNPQEVVQALRQRPLEEPEVSVK